MRTSSKDKPLEFLVVIIYGHSVPSVIPSKETGFNEIFDTTQSPIPGKVISFE
jgi:hypothetical protein